MGAPAVCRDGRTQALLEHS